jgi:hypothetical protein
MSHFTVLVVTDSPDDVEAALQPFHEYECTGIFDDVVGCCTGRSAGLAPLRILPT